MWELDGQNEEESWEWDQSQDRKVDLELSQLSQWDDPKGMEEPVTHQYRQVPSIQENVFGHRGVGFLKENMQIKRVVVALTYLQCFHINQIIIIFMDKPI